MHLRDLVYRLYERRLEAKLSKDSIPRHVGVIIDAAHQCMSTRGVHKPGVSMVTSRMLGAFRDDPSTRREFLSIVGQAGGNGLPNT